MAWLAAPLAYIGPGAGIALGASLLSLILAFLANLWAILLWPFRMAWGAVRYRRALRKAHVRKLIFIGFDGLDPRLTERFLAEGKLPNLARLREAGGYQRLRTTFPALSPVAWSTFATGVNPARHDIFDFLNRSARSYLPEFSAARMKGRTAEPRRRSESFWKILGRFGIPSTIIRVPVSFPPEKFHGRMLSAMGTPDLKGTQGEFTLFSTRSGGVETEGGQRLPLRRDGEGYAGELAGPESLTIPLRLTLRTAGARLEIQGEKLDLKVGEYTSWMRVKFRVARFRSVRGIVRFLLKEAGPEVSVYASPVEIDPESPAMPISHPRLYAIYLAKLLGSFATLGMAEDTWALNEGALSDRDFLKQAYDIFEERQAMFTDALQKTRRGVVGCVFDTSDRIQHMFFRQMNDEGADPELRGVIEKMYRRMDEVVGQTVAHVDASTAFLVLSDHGFCAFDRGVNLNSWLRENGYLKMKQASSEKYFDGVDWSATRAYALGLGGLYLNLAGREPEGTVAPGREASELKAELSGKLSALVDEENGRAAIRNVYDSERIYKGPYTEHAPDLVIGYHDGFRTAWGAAVGRTAGPVFETNDKAWSGDHCVDPPLVPGILFANRPIEAEDPGIEDMAPTVLSLFGVAPPAWMEGNPVFRI